MFYSFRAECYVGPRPRAARVNQRVLCAVVLFSSWDSDHPLVKKLFNSNHFISKPILAQHIKHSAMMYMNILISVYAVRLFYWEII